MATVVDLGIDSSRQFIHAAQQMAKRHSCGVRLQESGRLFSSRRLQLSPRLCATSVEFQVGDAMDLEALPAAAFHVVAAVNLICRLSRPKEFLRGLERLVVPGGQLLLASPFSWLQEHTATREWLTSSQVQDILKANFRLMRRRELPFLLREHRRKYQLVISEVLTFLRRA
jgi:SAM-dependent methyltransferase